MIFPNALMTYEYSAQTPNFNTHLAYMSYGEPGTGSGNGRRPIRFYALATLDAA